MLREPREFKVFRALPALLAHKVMLVLLVRKEYRVSRA